MVYTALTQRLLRRLLNTVVRLQHWRNATNLWMVETHELVGVGVLHPGRSQAPPKASQTYHVSQRHEAWRLSQLMRFAQLGRFEG